MKVTIDELERGFGVESKEDDSKNTSGRSSYGSTERSSQGSSVMLWENSSNGNESTLFPLQEYLVGSTAEFFNTTVDIKEQRTSLAELFQKTKGSDESKKGKWFENKRTHNETDWFSGNIMRKMLGRSQASRYYSEASDTADSDLTEEKVQKILKKFQTKLYPDMSKTTEISKAEKTKKKTKKSKISYNQALHNNDLMIPCQEIAAYPQSGIPKEGIQHFERDSNASISLISDVHENKGFWIKTDTDYLILEF